MPFEDAGADADIEQGERERARDRLAEAHDFGRAVAHKRQLREQAQEKHRFGGSATMTRHGRFPCGGEHWPSLANVSI
jgi:hypothetical protein